MGVTVKHEDSALFVGNRKTHLTNKQKKPDNMCLNYPISFKVNIQTGNQVKLKFTSDMLLDNLEKVMVGELKLSMFLHMMKMWV